MQNCAHGFPINEHCDDCMAKLAGPTEPLANAFARIAKNASDLEANRKITFSPKTREEMDDEITSLRQRLADSEQRVSVLAFQKDKLTAHLEESERQRDKLFIEKAVLEQRATELHLLTTRLASQLEQSKSDHEHTIAARAEVVTKLAEAYAKLEQVRQADPVVNPILKKGSLFSREEWNSIWQSESDKKTESTPQPSAPVAVVLPDEFESTTADYMYECGWKDYDAEVRRLNTEVATVQELAMLKTLARRAVWLAYAWNDHNFAAAHIMARETCASVGIRNIEDAENFAAAIQASQSQGE